MRTAMAAFLEWRKKIQSTASKATGVHIGALVASVLTKSKKQSNACKQKHLYVNGRGSVGWKCTSCPAVTLLNLYEVSNLYSFLNYIDKEKVGLWQK